MIFQSLFQTDSNNETGEPATSTLLKEKNDTPEELSMASDKNAAASTGSTLSITKSASPTKTSLECRVKTVVARDKATGKKVSLNSNNVIFSSIAANGF